MKTGLKVIDVMTREPVSVEPSISALACAILMKKEHLGSILVSKGDKLIGIVTEQDLVYKVIAGGRDPKITQVGEVMSEKLVTVSPELDINDAIIRMSDLNVRRLPVVDEGRSIGMVSIKDILKVQPALFDLIVDKIELMEEKSKPINKVGEREGICQLCGEYANYLFEQEEIFVCKNCIE